MFNKSIVIVVGAGASFDKYQLPLGGTLASRIAQQTDLFWNDRFSSRPSRGDPEFFESVIWRRFNSDRDRINLYTAAAQRLSAAIGSTVSVDDALYQLSEFPEAVEIGKICIMRSILAAERESTLKFDPQTSRLDPEAGRDGWIEQIFSMAITGLKLSEIKEAFQKITFVNFNYDRCIEHYLYWSLQRINLSANDAAEVVENLKIIRPYGTLGSIIPGSKHFLQFGAAAQRPNFFELIERIRTFTESDVLHDKQMLSAALLEASMIVFLGFGFHAQNLKLLSQSHHGSRDTKVLATVYQVHGANLPELTRTIASALRVKHGNIESYSMTASEMLRELRMKINLALG